MDNSLQLKKDFIKACSEGKFTGIYRPEIFPKMTIDDLNHGYYQACDNGHRELAYSLHQTKKISSHNNSMAFVDAAEKCNLLMAHQTYSLDHIEFSEVRWAIHKTRRNKEVNSEKCQQVLKWLSTLLPTEK